MFTLLSRTVLRPASTISLWTTPLSKFSLQTVTKPKTFPTITCRDFSTNMVLKQPTIRQLCRRPRKNAVFKTLMGKLDHCPQKKGTVVKVQEMTPKKPNSAKRKIARVRLSNGHQIITHLPGVGHNLQPHSIVLVRGGRCQDLIGVRYKPIRGKYDFGPVQGRMTRRSKYGVKLK
jgi:small subunit ribosomal protein S12